MRVFPSKHTAMKMKLNSFDEGDFKGERGGCGLPLSPFVPVVVVKEWNWLSSLMRDTVAGLVLARV